jgi:hypothetical protein
MDTTPSLADGDKDDFVTVTTTTTTTATSSSPPSTSSLLFDDDDVTSDGISSSSTGKRHHHKYNYYYESSYYYPHEGNSTLSTSVTIRLTPEHFYLVAWAILWGLFVLAIAFAVYQSHKEHQWLAAARKTISGDDIMEQGSTASGSAGGGGAGPGAGGSSGAGGRGIRVLVGGTSVTTSGGGGGGGAVGSSSSSYYASGSYSAAHSVAANTEGADGEAVSSGDLSRATVSACYAAN